MSPHPAPRPGHQKSRQIRFQSVQLIGLHPQELPKKYMRKPDESLNDFIAKPAPKVASKPPRPVSLQLTGEVEILNPLVRDEPAPQFRWTRRSQPVWFRRFLLAGSGALVMMAMVLVSAILIEMSDSREVAEVAPAEEHETVPVEAQTSVSFDVFSPSEGADVITGVRRNSRAIQYRTRFTRAAYKPRRTYRSLPQPEEPKFVPTTLVIYAENGVIKRRVEPWLRNS